MISCSDAVKRLWEYLDDTVGQAEHEEVDEHLSLCRRCCGELEFAVELRRLLAASGRRDIPDDVMRRLNQTLNELD
ncbi:zf-HC2 domain-containing protein [Streptomyces sp. NPDC059909]|uniref:zf-HC2 domain-containing protein n=1 Tax=Streptomyces sp. NPDC059909 TaxID=3346998 RepID=UPI00365BDB4C